MCRYRKKHLPSDLPARSAGKRYVLAYTAGWLGRRSSMSQQVAALLFDLFLHGAGQHRQHPRQSHLQMHFLFLHPNSARDGLADRGDEKVQGIALPALFDAFKHASGLALEMRRLLGDASPGLASAELMGNSESEIRHGFSRGKSLFRSEFGQARGPRFIPSSVGEADKGSPILRFRDNRRQADFEV